MPNVLGIYSLAELRDRTRRVMNGVRRDVNPTTGIEDPASQTIDALFSNDDLNFYINSAITATWADTVLASDTPWADEALIDIELNRMEYNLPSDLAQLRNLWWKDPSTPLSLAPMSARRLMNLWDEGSGLPAEMQGGAPTYRRNLDQVWLNEPEFVSQPNVGGIMVRYIKWRNFLDNDDATLETEFAPLLQEVVIRAAAVEGLSERSQLDTSQIQGVLTKWEQRLSLVVRNATNPPFAQMVTKHPVTRRIVRLA